MPDGAVNRRKIGNSYSYNIYDPTSNRYIVMCTLNKEVFTGLVKLDSSKAF